MNAGNCPDIIAIALAEDVGKGDITSEFFATPGRNASARIVARNACVLAGAIPVAEVFLRVDPALDIRGLLSDGTALAGGDVVLEVAGAAASILTAERTALNFLQHLSGVATMASKYVQAVHGTRAVILDTRKTTPGLRVLEKMAVTAGGGSNHRMGLHDMVMVKDNHLSTAGGVAALQDGIRRVRMQHPGVKVEVEVDTIEQLREVLRLDGVDIVLLDNMSLDGLRQAVALRKPGVLFEASGGVTLDSVAGIAATGVDFISVGAITHSAPAADFSLEFEAR